MNILDNLLIEMLLTIVLFELLVAIPLFIFCCIKYLTEK